MTASGSSIRTLSVISRLSSPGSRPLARSARSTIRGRSECATWRRERLTDTQIGSASGRPACHAAAWRQAVSRTRFPISTMAPFSSATAMNSAGASSPRSGCCQRARASMPDDAAARQAHDRLVVDAQLVLGQGPAQVVLDPQAVGGACAHDVVVDLDLSAAALLRPVHGGVGLADEILALARPALRHGDADAPAHDVLGAVRARTAARARRSCARRGSPPPRRPAGPRR